MHQSSPIAVIHSLSFTVCQQYLYHCIFISVDTILLRAISTISITGLAVTNPPPPHRKAMPSKCDHRCHQHSPTYMYMMQIKIGDNWNYSYIIVMGRGGGGVTKCIIAALLRNQTRLIVLYDYNK